MLMTNFKRPGFFATPLKNKVNQSDATTIVISCYILELFVLLKTFWADLIEQKSKHLKSVGVGVGFSKC